jgi:AraC-like DNA-binding protein
MTQAILIRAPVVAVTAGSSKSRPLRTRWTNRVGGFVLAPAIVRELGADPAAVLATCRLPPNALDDPDAAIEYGALDRFLGAGVTATGRADLGLLVGERYRIDHLGPLGELMRSSETLGEALRVLGAYHRLNSDSAAAYLQLEGGEALLAYAVYQPWIRNLAQIHELALACFLACIHDMSGHRLLPTCVLFAHSAPHDSTTHRRIFGRRIVFDADRTALVFPAGWLERQLPGADARRREAIERALANGPAGPLLPLVYRALRVQLTRTATSGDELAALLDMHRRTFNRRLRAEGTTFRRVLDDVRFEVARQLLENSAAPLLRISQSLGYGEASAFTRAFKRWSGRTPAQWRQRRTERSPTGEARRTGRRARA